VELDWAVVDLAVEGFAVVNSVAVGWALVDWVGAVSERADLESTVGSEDSALEVRAPVDLALVARDDLAKD
jgi:hypothetical protein